MTNIVLSYMFYPMAIGRYFEAALRRRKDVELFTIGPFTGVNIPWNGGMNLPQKYAIAPNMPIQMTNAFPYGIVEARLSFKPDIWLMIDAGFYLKGRPKNGQRVIVGTDPHVLNYDNQRWESDHFFCMQTPYMKKSDKYLPYAYDPIWHAPKPETERTHDVTLLGLHYPERNQLVQELRDKGINVHYDLGPSFDEARSLYAAGPIGLNWSSKQDLCARVFELLGMKRLAVVNNVPDIGNFFVSGRDLIVFSDLNDAIEKVIYHVNNEAKTAEIAENGHLAVRSHTWDNRIEQILNEVL